MNICGNCGASVNDNVNFCPSCGKKVVQESTNQANQNTNPNPNPNPNINIKFNAQDINEKIQSFNDTKDYSNDFDSADIQANKGLSVLSYIYILFLIPLIGAPNSKFARFHVNQGLILFICNLIFNIPLSIIIAIVDNIPYIGWISFIFNILRIIPVIFMVIGIINAAGGKAKELPFIGKFRILN